MTTRITSFVPTSEFWTYFNHWLVWANGCVRMPTFVKGMNRWTFEVKGTTNGEPVRVSASAPTLLAAVESLQAQMQQHLTDASFQSILAGAAGGGLMGRGEGSQTSSGRRPASTGSFAESIACMCGKRAAFDPAVGAYRCSCGLVTPR